MERRADSLGLFPSSIDYTITGPEIDPEQGYAVIEIGDGLYWTTYGMYQIMFETLTQRMEIINATVSRADP